MSPLDPSPLRHIPSLIRCFFRARSMLVFLHMLLEPLLALGHELSQLGFLLRGKNLVCLGGNPGMLNLELCAKLRSLGCNGLRFGFIKSATLDELHHLLAALHLLFKKRLHR